MPRTQKTCVELGIPYVYDLIIDSCEEVYKLISERMYGLESADGIIFNKSGVWKKIIL